MVYQQQHNNSWKEDSHGKKFAAYSNPELFRLLNDEKHLHINDTFHCIPKGYKQMLVVIIYDKDIETYVDILHVLINGK